MAATTLRAHGASHPGRDRANNEDRLFHDAARGIFIVADGMGGHAAGERAADTTVAVLRARLEPIDGPPAERLREAFTLANNEVHRLAGTNPAWHGMAAVATAAIVRGSRVTVGHVGDTRAYSLRNGSLRKITRDHSPVGEREDRGEIGEHDAMRHPRRHEVYRDIGSQPRELADSEFVEIAEFPFEDDTALLLCTDGLTDLVPSDVIARVIREHAGDGASVAERLVDAANAAGGRDNVSVVYVEGPAFAASVPNWPAGPSTPFAPPGARGDAWSTRAALIGSGILGALLLIWLAAQFTDRMPDWLLGQTRPRAWSRTWTVGVGGSADGSTIGAVLSMAGPGDTVRVEPGIYRERVVVDRAVHLVSARPLEAVITPPAGAEAGWTAVELRAGAAGRFSGFTVAGDDSRALSVGVRVLGPSTRLEEVEVRGAQRAGIEIGQGGTAALSACYVHDNAGAGVIVGNDAAPILQHNVITRNGAGLPVRPAGSTGGSGLVASPSARPLLFGNIIVRNAGGELAGLDVDEMSDARRDNILEAPVPAAPARPRTSAPGAAPGPGR